MNLPDGVGTTIPRHGRDQNLPIKVAVASGTRDAELVEEANRRRPDASFNKPADVDALMDWIATGA